MSNINEIIKILEQTYPDTQCELHFRTPFELLISTILSAQATDKKVNEITHRLFSKYRTPDDFAALSQDEMEQEIKEIHFFPQKARYILSACRTLMYQHGGNVPADREKLVQLSGVGRKTANVILSYVFNIPSIAVDTHVFRVANRLGIVQAGSPQKTELEMEKIIPKEYWIKSHSSLVLHGRRVCEAKKPRCSLCQLKQYCKYYHDVCVKSPVVASEVKHAG